MWVDVLSRDVAGIGPGSEAATLEIVGAGIDQVAGQLAAEFDGVVEAARVERIVLAARRDLEGDVPTGSLPELVHRLAKQRLLNPDDADDGRRSGLIHRPKGT